MSELNDLYLFTSNLSRRAYYSSNTSKKGKLGFDVSGVETQSQEVLPKHKQKIVTKRGNPPLTLKKKLDAPN